MDKTDLSIIIVHHQLKEITLDCIKSIKDNVLNVSYEIIVVDNSKKEDNRIQISDISKILPSAFCLLPSTNKGFGAGNNLGAKSKGRVFTLLNPDTLVFDNSIEKMLSS